MIATGKFPGRSLLLLISVLGACTANPSAPIGQVPPEVANAPTEIAVRNVTITLDVGLWRNFMPGSNVDTRLMTLFGVTSASGSAVPPDLRADKAWLVRGNESWVSTPRQEQPPPSPNRVEYMSRQGPMWPVGDLVTGVLRLRDAQGHTFYIRSSPIAIGRVE